METAVFREVSVILAIAVVMAGLIRLSKQPLIIAYILTGVLVGPSFLNLFSASESMELFSRIGVALLLFIIGLGLNPRVIREVGKVAMLTGVGQILITTSIGFIISRLLGFAVVPSLYIAIAIAFSSTIIILKLLSDKKDTNRLYGKIAIGFLLVQDIVAIFALIAISSLHTDVSGTTLVVQTLAKGVLFVTGLTLFTAYVLPRLSSFFAKSQELLLLFSIGWGLGISALVVSLGFSIEIGALAAGVALASSPYSYEINSRLRPLRDFFIILFFITLGAELSLVNLSQAIIPALVFSVVILIGNPIIVMSIMGLLGYAKKTSFKAGLVVAQISEFSLIIILLGSQLGQLPATVIALMTLVGIITITGCTYMVLNSDKLFSKLEPYLGIFERKQRHPERQLSENYDIILFGYIAGSQHFINTFKKLKKKFLVVDYNPETIDYLQSRGIPCRYGDAIDTEFLEQLPLDKVRLAVINITEFAANKLVVNHVRLHSKQAVIIAMDKTDEIESSLELYEDGADYVMMPHHQASVKISDIIKKHGTSSKHFRKLKAKHAASLLKEVV